MAGPVDLQEFLEGFLVEADEHLGTATVQLVALDEAASHGKAHPRAVRELFRALHTIKGLGAMVGVEPVVDLAHELETVLRAADRAGGRLSSGAVELLLRGVRAIEERVAALGRRQPVAAAPRDLLDALAGLEPAATPEAPQQVAGLAPELDAKLSASEREQLLQAAGGDQSVYRVDFIPSPDKASRGLTITKVRELLSARGDLVKVLPRPMPGTPGGLAFSLLFISRATPAELSALIEAGPEAVTALGRREPPPEAPGQPPEPEEAAEGGAQLHGYIRVNVARLDDALDKLSELVVTRFKLTRACADLGARGVDTRELAAILHENSRQLRDLRGAIMQARMVSLAELLQRVPLLVRGLTRGTDKAVALALRIGGAELDKTVAERLHPALMHLLRNAVDHALETKAERRRAGKPEEGRLSIVADEISGSWLTLSVGDDGRGIDRVALARKAAAPVPETDDALLDLICRPGLSARAAADHTSGRGMGMDIVRRSVEQLGGTLAVTSTAGAGTTFTMRVPLSVTIVDTFSFTAARQVFVTPVALVEEIIEVDAARVVEAPRPGRKTGARMIERRGEPLPLLPLDALLSLEGASPEAPKKALIVRRNGVAVAYGVDRMLGQQEVVVRPVDDPLVRRPGVAGATDLGEGRPVLVLDLLALGAADGGRAFSQSGARVTP